MRKSKYIEDDIDWLRVMCEEYNDIEMHNIYLKAIKALKTKNYDIRFTEYQKEVLANLYENKQYLTDGELNVLYKILGF